MTWKMGYSTNIFYKSGDKSPMNKKIANHIPSPPTNLISLSIVIWTNYWWSSKLWVANIFSVLFQQTGTRLCGMAINADDVWQGHGRQPFRLLQDFGASWWPTVKTMYSVPVQAFTQTLKLHSLISVIEELNCVNKKWLWILKIHNVISRRWFVFNALFNASKTRITIFQIST